MRRLVLLLALVGAIALPVSTRASAAETFRTDVVEAADGTDLVVETWLPPGDGPFPVVLSISPYLGVREPDSPWLRDLVVPHGYAYANLAVRGTGQSGGCLDLFGPIEAADSARVIEWLGTEAPFSNGSIGAYGISYPGGTPLSVAGRHPSPHLKAIISGAPYHSMHEAHWTFDGVPSFLIPATMVGNYAITSALGAGYDSGAFDPHHPEERPGCQVANALGGLDWSGNHSPWHEARDNRAWTSNITAPVLMFHGHPDLVPMGGSPPSIQRGLFDALPPSTPKVGIFGMFGHSRPNRADFDEMVLAWLDHWVRDIPSGVRSWPTVQVQGTDGRWHAEEDWPLPRGPVAELALGAGMLGASAPSGSTVYLEGPYEMTTGHPSSAVFETPPLEDRLELTGQPELDLWLTLAVPDAHVAARLEVLDAGGTPIPKALTYGLRSAQHLEPYTDGRFTQRSPVLAPTGTPVLVPVRFQPTDLVVPPGGRLRLTVAGSLIVNPGLAQLGIPEPIFLGPSQASGVVAPVTIHHDCAHPSVLRFVQPGPDAATLTVEGDVPPTRATAQRPDIEVDGGGLATAGYCTD